MGFFLEAARSLQTLPYKTALFHFLDNGLKTYQIDKQISQIQLADYVNLYLLFLRGPAARHETELLKLAVMFDQAMQSYTKDQLQFRDSYYGHQGQLTNLDKTAGAILRQLFKKYIAYNYYEWRKNNLQFQMARFRSYYPLTEPVNLAYYRFEGLSYFQKEFEENRITLEQQLRCNYHFFTYMFNQMIEQASQLSQLQPYEFEALINLFWFAYSRDPGALFQGMLIKIDSRQSERGSQLRESQRWGSQVGQKPQYSELKMISDISSLAIKEEDYLVFNKQQQIYRMIGLLQGHL